jgi:DNA-binding CsgD family transcriptional regulator
MRTVRSPTVELVEATERVAAADLDPVRVLAAGLEAMRAMVSANRADGGFVRRRSDVYRPSHVATDPTTMACAVEVSAGDDLVVNVLAHDRVFAVHEVEEVLPEGPLRAQLSESCTRSIVVRRLATDDDPFGLVCLDWVGVPHQSTVEELSLLDLFSARVLAPLLREAWATGASGPRPAHPPLSPAELEVALLAAEGLTYAEIADTLDKSVSTVGHQLAAARRKTGARNGVELSRALRGLPGAR